LTIKAGTKNRGDLQSTILTMKKLNSSRNQIVKKSLEKTQDINLLISKSSLASLKNKAAKAGITLEEYLISVIRKDLLSN